MTSQIKTSGEPSQGAIQGTTAYSSNLPPNAICELLPLGVSFKNSVLSFTSFLYVQTVSVGLTIHNYFPGACVKHSGGSTKRPSLVPSTQSSLSSQPPTHPPPHLPRHVYARVLPHLTRPRTPRAALESTLTCTERHTDVLRRR